MPEELDRAGVPDSTTTEDVPEPGYAQIFDVVPAPLLLLTPELTIVDANRARLESTSTSLQETVGRHLFDVLPPNPDDPEAEGPRILRGSLERVRDTRRPDTVPIQRYDIPMPDGRFVERFWSYRTVPVLDEGDRVVLLVHRADDVTDYVRYRGEARRRSVERLQLIESDLFARIREMEQVNVELRAASERERHTAQKLAGLATTVSALSTAESRADLLRQMFRHGRGAVSADALAVALLEPGGTHLAVMDSGGGAIETRPMSVHSPSPIATATAGRPVFQQDAQQHEGDAAVPPLPGLRSWAAFPLRIGRRPLGSLTLGWNRPQVFEADDVRVLEAFAAECSQAVNRVTRREVERRRAHTTRSLAETLQRSLLTRPPQPEHLDIAVRYRPAAREAQIGGDWYDAFLSPVGDTTLVVGDVTGHDWTAATVAGQLRSMLRGIASVPGHGQPQRVLSALDRALHETGIATLATAVVARVEEPPDTSPDGHRLLRWSNAGHPPPLLLGPDGTAELLERPADLLLGVAPDVPRRHHTVFLRPGATVVLYTDGLVERRDATLDEGLDRLLTVAHDLADHPVQELCDEILHRMEPELTDDIALVAVRVHEPE